MAGFTILYHPQVISKDMPRLDGPSRIRIRAAIERKLVTSPVEFAKPLAYTRERLWSLRVGPWRVVFALREEELWILRIGHRADVYNKLEGRLVPR